MRRALLLAPLGGILVLGIPVVWGWRSNLSTLGPDVAWGLSALQALVGLFVLGAALREAVPGRTLSRAAIAATATVALALEAGVTLVTAATAPSVVPPGRAAQFAWECLGVAVVSGVPFLAAAGWLAARALPNRPAITGAIYGLAAGLVTDAGVRLFCQISEPAHVLLAHGSAIALLTGIGVLTAILADRLRG
jgi:hypothetical protein